MSSIPLYGTKEYQGYTPRRPRRNDLTRDNVGDGSIALAPAAATITGSIGTMTGYASVFDLPYKVFEDDMVYMERVQRGAFASSLTGPLRESIVCQFNHSHDPLLGSRPIGPWLELREDDYGLRYSVA